MDNTALPNDTIVARHSQQPQLAGEAARPVALVLATMAARDGAKASVPKWIQLLPAGEFSGEDGRGPYSVEDADRLIALSMKGGRKLPLDENHAKDLLGPKGQPSPARGWIVELQSRDSGLWGRVEWTPKGRELIENREYGYISPAVMHTKTQPWRIVQITGASLVNEPNLIMKSLHNKETPMEQKLRELLGLDDTADQQAIMTALHARLKEGEEQGELVATFAKALDLKEGAGGDELVTSLNARLTATPETGGGETGGEDGSKIAELEATVKALQSKLTEEVSTNAKARAEAVVGQAVEDLRLVPALKEHYIARHMKNPKEVEDELKLMPSLHSGSLSRRPAVEGGAGVLAPADEAVCALMGIDPEAFAKTAKKFDKEAL